MSEFLSRGMNRASRPLTEQEQALVLWLLDHADPTFKHFATQIGNLTVAATCNCGCPTIYFAFNDKPLTRKGERIVAEFQATIHNVLVGIMLFETENILSSLEVYSCAGTDKPFGLPALNDIFSWEEYSTRSPLTGLPITPNLRK